MVPVLNNIGTAAACVGVSNDALFSLPLNNK